MIQIMKEPTNRNEWIFGHCKNILEDKDYMIKQLVVQMLQKTTKMFEYKNLPQTITVKDLETQLQVGGYNIWKEKDGKLYCFNGQLGGQPNPYYLPTIAIIANPALPEFNGSYEIDKDCVVMLNDHYYQGMMPLFNKYATLLAEAEISLRYAIVLTRTSNIAIADNDNSKKSADEYFKKIVDGTGFGCVTSVEFFEGIKTAELQKDSKITDIIEATQYIKGSWYNEVGLNAAFNMKREAINEAEANLNEDVLIPIVDVMLECRKLALEKINNMFGTNITVDLSSVWKQNRERDELTTELQEAEIDNLENEVKEEDNSEDIGNDNENTKTDSTDE